MTLSPHPVPEGWSAPLDRWRASLVSQGSSPETVRTRVQHVSTVARALRVPPGEVTAEQLVSWCLTRSWATETRAGYYASLRGFFDFLGGDSPAAALPRVKRQPGRPRPAPEEVVAEAISQADERVRMILILAARYGLRAGEVARVHRSWFQPTRGGWLMVVAGKGGRTRELPLRPGFARHLMQTCEANGGWLFPGQVDGHLSRRWVGTLAQRVLTPPWTMHSLRHRFATQAYSADRDLIVVQRLLGHASVATTQVYADPPDDAVWRALDAAEGDLVGSAPSVPAGAEAFLGDICAVVEEEIADVARGLRGGPLTLAAETSPTDAFEAGFHLALARASKAILARLEA